MTRRGKLIMFDGLDGAGKTTQLGLAATELRESGREVLETRIIGGTEIGEALREVSLSHIPRTALTDLYISSAIYAQLASEIAKPRSRGVDILIDRSPLSKIAYQGHGGGLDKKTVLASTEEDINRFRPDLIIVYDAAVDIVRQRVTSRNQANRVKADYFESKSNEYFERVAAGYREAAKYFGAAIIDATRPIDQVHTETMALISA